MTWLSRLFAREDKPCPTCTLYERRCEELRQLLAEEREDRRKTEDAWRANVASAKSIFEPPSQVESVAPDHDESYRKLIEADIMHHIDMATMNDTHFSIARDMAANDPAWLYIYRAALDRRRELDRTPSDPNANGDGDGAIQ